MVTRLDCNLPGLKKMSSDELKQTSGGGGIFFSALSTFAFMYAVDIAVNWNDHVNAFKEGYHKTRNK